MKYRQNRQNNTVKLYYANSKYTRMIKIMKIKLKIEIIKYENQRKTNLRNSTEKNYGYNCTDTLVLIQLY